MALHLLESIVRLIFAILPQKAPEPKLIANAKVIAHRGVKDNGTLENTLEAFRKAQPYAWGIEFDVRWTKDNVPVVHHDAHCGRLFDKPQIIISEINWEELHREVPDIPKLSDVVQQFAPSLHLMIEVKTRLTVEQLEIFKSMLSHLQPIRDYHILSLDKKNFASLNKFPSQSFLPVAELNVGEMSQEALINNYAGVAGHFLLLNDALLNTHKNKGQGIGVGYADSPNSLYREIHRGVEWIFTNHLLALNLPPKASRQ